MQTNLFLHDSDDNIRYDGIIGTVEEKNEHIETKAKQYGNNENKKATSDLPAFRSLPDADCVLCLSV